MKYVKLYEQFNLDIDPYGEEDWEYDNSPPVLQIVRQQNKPYDQITFLDCCDNQLTDLEGIENLINLKELWCSSNQLTSLKGIENLVNLKILYCHNNQLTSLEEIKNIVNLTGLYCYNNQFSNEYKDYLRKYCKEKNIRLFI
jgi:hypothetical protein